MPSPFPGMDPYLEVGGWWRGVHHLLVTYIMEQLQPTLPRGLVAAVEERVYVASMPRKMYIPDLSVRGFPPDFTGVAETAVLSGCAQPLVIEGATEEVHEPYVEILDVEDDERVVTVIEVLSPSNKRLGSEGYNTYREKQAAVLKSRANLVEIDLLRNGVHTAAVPPDLLVELKPYEYLVCVNPACNRRRFELYAIALDEPLPRFAVPLNRNENPDVPLDLQAVFNRCYDNGRFADRIDYTWDPSVPFPERLAGWVSKVRQDAAAR